MKKTLLIALVLVSGLVQAAHYPAGTVAFNGSISDTTCNVMVSGIPTIGGVGVIVAIPDVTTAAFTGIAGGATGAGAIAPASTTPFTLNITGCDSSMNMINLMFSGTPDTDQPSTFANNIAATSGGATGVSLLLKDFGAGLNVFSPNMAALQYQYPVVTGSASIPLLAELMQTTAQIPTAGAFRVNTTLSLIY